MQTNQFGTPQLVAEPVPFMDASRLNVPREAVIMRQSPGHIHFLIQHRLEV